MGLSLSVLVALVVLLPGAMFVFGLSRLYSPTSPATLLDQHISVGLALALVAAIALQAVWLSLWCALLRWAGAPIPDVSQVFGLLAGNLKAPQAQEAMRSLQAYPARIAAYLVSLALLSWLIGKGANRFLPVRRTASWYNILRQEGVAFVWLTTDIHLDGRCYLYAGWVKEFSVSRDGSLERVVLGYAVRRPLDGGPAEEGIEVAKGWTEIAGEFVVLLMRDAQTVNIDYFFENDSSAGDQVSAAAPEAEHG